MRFDGETLPRFPRLSSDDRYAALTGVEIVEAKIGYGKACLNIEDKLVKPVHSDAAKFYIPKPDMAMSRSGAVSGNFCHLD